MAEQDRGLTSKIGPVEVDWPRSAGYFGGIALAVAVGVIDPPVGVFIAAIPFIKMLNRPRAPRALRIVAQVFDGAAKPVGGDSEATIQINTPDQPAEVGPTEDSPAGAKRTQAKSPQS